MAETKIQPLLTWRSAICDSNLPSTTRHIALTLSLWMNERAASAFPGAGTLAQATGLSERAVREHLRALVTAGWLELVERGGVRGERKHANHYRASTPNPTLAFDPGPTVTGDAGSRVTEAAPTPESDGADPCTRVTPSLQDLSTNSGRPRKRAIAPPKNFVPTIEHERFAVSQGLELDDEVRRWLLDCEAKGKTYKVVNAGFSTWLHFAVDFGRGGKVKPATLEELATPAAKAPTKSCPLGLCKGTFWVDVPGKAQAVPCRCRRMKANA